MAIHQGNLQPSLLVEFSLSGTPSTLPELATFDITYADVVLILRSSLVMSGKILFRTSCFTSSGACVLEPL